MSDKSELIVKDVAGVRHLILNRPQKLNAIDYAQHLRLLQAFEAAADDNEVKVVALSGLGRAFSAGDDLSQTPFEGDDPFSYRKVDLEMGSGPVVLLESAKKLRRLPKPTVALMHGVALGSGYDYSLSCDFRVASPDLRYGDPRIKRALWAAEGWSYKLPRLTNLSITSQVAYQGEEMNAKTAMEFGLVSVIVDSNSDIRKAAQPFLDRLLQLAGPAYASTKTNFLNSLDCGFTQALNQAV